AAAEAASAPAERTVASLKEAIDYIESQIKHGGQTPPPYPADHAPAPSTSSAQAGDSQTTPATPPPSLPRADQEPGRPSSPPAAGPAPRVLEQTAQQILQELRRRGRPSSSDFS